MFSSKLFVKIKSVSKQKVATRKPDKKSLHQTPKVKFGTSVKLAGCSFQSRRQENTQL